MAGGTEWRRCCAQIGDSGYRVRHLQVLLNSDYPAHPHLTVGGDFEPQAGSLVREFYCRAVFLVTGVVNAVTLQQLGASFALT